MNGRFLSYLAAGFIGCGFVACGSDDDEDDGQSSSSTTQTTSSTSSGGSAGSGGSGATSNTTGTTQGTGVTIGAGGTASSSGGSAGMGGAGGEAGGGGEGGMAGATALTDEAVLHVARTANIGEVDQAEVALLRADDELVVDFAELMIQEHSSAIAMAQSLADSEDLTPEANPLSQMLQADSSQTVLMLQAASDAEFDLVYMESQVTAHEEVLTLLDDTLIPEADNAALETYLLDLRVHVSEHLESAESIVEALE